MSLIPFRSLWVPKIPLQLRPLSWASDPYLPFLFPFQKSPFGLLCLESKYASYFTIVIPLQICSLPSCFNSPAQAITIGIILHITFFFLIFLSHKLVLLILSSKPVYAMFTSFHLYHHSSFCLISLSTHSSFLICSLITSSSNPIKKSTSILKIKFILKYKYKHKSQPFLKTFHNYTLTIKQSI